MTMLLSNGMTMDDLLSRGAERYPNVFKPLVINNIKIPNRIYFSPFGIDNANPDGTISNSLENFYMGIARGGCGLTMLSNCSISPDSILNPRGLRMYQLSHSEKLKSLINRVESYGGIVGIQLQHYGAQAITTYSKKELLSPSGIGCQYYSAKDPNYIVRAMTLDDIDTVKKQYIEAAVLSAGAGVKFIQLQASNGYLLHSFISPYTNKRSDEYGGCYQNRVRLLIEIIQGIKKRLNDSVILSLTIGVNDGLGEKGVQPKDYEVLMPMLQESGINALTVSVSIAETFNNLLHRTSSSHDNLHDSVASAKQYLTSQIPVGFSGFTNSLEVAEQLISTKTINFVGMGRSLFADNDLILKCVDGNENLITHCLWDGFCLKDKNNPVLDRVYCCVNPKYKRPEFVKYNY